MQVVEAIRAGDSPTHAAESAVRRMAQFYPDYVGALVAVNAKGEHGAAAHGWQFRYAVQDGSKKEVRVIEVKPLGGRKEPSAIA